MPKVTLGEHDVAPINQCEGLKRCAGSMCVCVCVTATLWPVYSCGLNQTDDMRIQVCVCVCA